MGAGGFFSLFLAFGLADAASCYDQTFEKADWPFCEQLASDILMYYGPSGDFVKLGLFVESHQAWSSVALGGNGGMKGAQQFVVRKVNGEFAVEERYSADYTTPQLQATQEVKLIFASEEAGNIAWGVLLPKTSCAEGERYPIEDVSRFMHWALGASHDFTHHPRRGQFHANLISGPTVELDMSGYQNISMTMPNVPVVLGPGGYDQKNPYVCNIFNLEEMLPAGLTADNKHHVAMFSPILDPDSVQYVHHMILYACNDQAGVSFSHNQVVPECESMPRGCSELKWPWAMGSEPVVFPPQVGMPIGQGQKWFALQMHYYNPSLHTGVTDSSGVRISLADSVRAYDAGAFRFNGGTGPSMRAALPPGVPLLTVKQALLPAACTNEWQEDVNVLGVVYHAHLVGKRLNIEVLRGSESLGELRKEKLYDFNHQSLEPASVKTLKKGDQLVMTCTYDTSSRTTPTQFGDSTQTEMCWSAFMYYPVQKMNRVLFTSEDWMLCEGAAQQYHANTIPSIPASTCQAVGDVGSQTALDLLASMGVNVTGVTERPSTSSTSPEGLSVSASTTASGWLLAVWAFSAF